jgi:predicted small secreted protein
MRRALVLIAALAACTTKQGTGQDSAAAAGDVSTTLHASDVVGTWTGTTMAGTTDSVVSRWKLVTQNDSMSIIIIEGAPDTIRAHNVYAADSLVSTSEPFTLPSMPGAKLTFVAVGRLENGNLRGTVVDRLASNPDSVVARDHWEAKREK